MSKKLAIDNIRMALGIMALDTASSQFASNHLRRAIIMLEKSLSKDSETEKSVPDDERKAKLEYEIEKKFALIDLKKMKESSEQSVWFHGGGGVRDAAVKNYIRMKEEFLNKFA
jgi:hypothetical protein